MGLEDIGYGLTAAQVSAAFNSDAQLDRVSVILEAALNWFEQSRPEIGPGTLPQWVVDARASLGRKPR